MFKNLKTVFISISLFVLSSLPSFASEGEVLGAPCIVDAYLRAQEKAMQTDATSADVDQVMNLIGTDFVYEHPRVGFVIDGSDKFREGLTAFLGATDDGRYEVLDYIVNGNTVVIALNRIFKTQKEETWQEQTVKQLVVFEVNAGKITRIIDYW